MEQHQEFEFLKLSENKIRQLNKLNIFSDWDLILHIPLRYEDNTKVTPFENLQIGERYIVEGTVVAKELKYIGRKQFIVKISDGKYFLYIRLINFYPNQIKIFEIGKTIRATGQIRKGYLGYEMVHPVIDSSPVPLNSNYLTPIYPTVSGLTQKNIASYIDQTLNKLNLNELLPEKLLQEHDLPTFAKTINFLHHPPARDSVQSFEQKYQYYLRRLKFDELLAQQLALQKARMLHRQQKTFAIKGTGVITEKFKNLLTFELTQSQLKCILEIKEDLKRTIPMNRLLQGDVGSGKTVVAALAALWAVEAKYQVAIVAPTEILAEQHLNKFQSWMNPLKINVAILKGKQKLSDKKQIKQDIADNKINIIIGTHALFQQDVSFKNLGLAIIDEQHRFGVEQRFNLKNKGNNIHQLMMTATPIPRTLTMSYLADLDVSTIDELPPGRVPVTNKLINSNKRNKVIDAIKSVKMKNQQVYWVCPLIEESEKLQLETAINTTENLKKILPEFKVELIHGKLKPQEKNEIMLKFKHQAIDILVATTVIEVGIDVPNASLMIIENSERIGLSQLHQLRGRVGRGNTKSYCIFMYSEPISEVAKKRLKVIYENNNGFEISKQDLEIRGPGELLGIKQSGAPLFRFANIMEDFQILNLVKKVVTKLSSDKNIYQNYIQIWNYKNQNLLKT